jgi:hypothetical protein
VCQECPVCYRTRIPKPRSAALKYKSLYPALCCFFDLTFEQNRETIAMRRIFDLRARVPQAKALPETMFSYGYMGNPVPIPRFDVQKGDPLSGCALSFSQEFPFVCKLAIKVKMTNVAAEAEW